MPRKAQVRATALIDFPAVAMEAGIDPYAPLRAQQIDPALLAQHDVTLDADRVAWLLDGVAERSNIADLSIRLAMRRRLANLGIAGLLLVQQPTVRQALAMADRYRHLLSDVLSQHVEEEDGVATLLMGVAFGSSAPHRQARELGLSSYVHLFRLLLGEHWAPLCIHFSHPAPKGPTLHHRFFGCPVQFDSPIDGLECSVDDLDRVNCNADAALANYAGVLLDTLPGPQRGVASIVSRLVQALLPMGRASIDDVARAMSRNVRTLQRELAAQGTDFTTILAEARSSLAMHLLRDPSLTVEVIAERLGYSHPSAFIRFFQREFGMSPKAWAQRATPDTGAP